MKATSVPLTLRVAMCQTQSIHYNIKTDEGKIPHKNTVIQLKSVILISREGGEIPIRKALIRVAIAKTLVYHEIINLNKSFFYCEVK